MARILSAIENDFVEELTLYDKVLVLTQLISLNQQGIKADPRGVRGMKIFTRQTLTGLSIRRLFPNPSPERDRDADLWDIGSLASLSRNLMEGYMSLDYFSLEKISESEADLRFQLLQLHRNIEWYNIRSTELSDEERLLFEQGIPEQREKVRMHPYFNSLSGSRKKRVLQCREMYKAKPEFQNETPFCNSLVEHYRWLSNLIHPVPLSIERVDNERGRGLGTDNDALYCLQSLMLARKYLAASTIGIADYFSERFAKTFQVLIDEVRPLRSKGF